MSAKKSAAQDLQSQTDNKDKVFANNLPFLWKFTDFDLNSNRIILLALRLFQAVFLTSQMMNPDEYWQSTQVAYKWVYGDKGDVVLPWEWSEQWQLRNTLYPLYLSLPLRLVRFLQIDSNLMVRIIPYIAHCPFVLLNDLYTWKVSKLIVGKNAARVAMILVFFNRFQSVHMTRTLTNSLEQTFTMVAFFYYLEQRDKFNKNTIILTALITISFMMRNTSPVGWVPLLAIKVLKEGSLIPFLLSGVFVALPIILLCIWIDTTMYGASNWVVTSYNFLQMNIVMGLSKTFGEDPWHWYLSIMMPVHLTLLTPFAFISVLYNHIKSQNAKGRTPYIAIYIIFYVFFFSLIAHKEIRFMLPVWSFILVCIAEFWSFMLQKQTKLFSFLLKLIILVETITFLVIETQTQQWYRVRHDLANINPPIHSVWLWDSLGTPHYSLLHRPESPIKVYGINQNPFWYRNMQGDPLPINLEHGMTFCIETIDLLTRAVIRPQYVLFGSIGCLNNRGDTCERLCQYGMQRLKHEDGGDLYELVHVYDDIHVDLLITEDFDRIYTARNNYLYRLKDEYQPY